MSDFDFEYNPDPNDFSNPYQPRRSSPWKWVAIVGGIVVVIGLLVGAYFLLGPRILGLTPDATVRAYYQALNTQDYEKAREYLDASLASTAIQVADYAKQQVTSIAKELGANLDLKIEFLDLKFTRKEWKGDTAIVHVSGKVKITETLTNLNLPFNYELDHNLVKKDGKWLIVP